MQAQLPRRHCLHSNNPRRHTQQHTVHRAAAPSLLAAGRAAAAAHSSTSSSSTSTSSSGPGRRTGYCWHELFFWHSAGPWGNLCEWVQPLDRSPEHAETKRRLHNLVSVSGLLDQLQELRPRPATVAELTRAHTPQYIMDLQAMSGDDSKGIHRVGDESAFMPGGFQIAALAAGGALTATDAVLEGALTNAYVLSRPPGHHATRSTGGGYCLLNGVAVAALHALEHHQLERVAIVDFDVHHANGTADIFEEDPRVLLISLHQDSNYPTGSGPITDVGSGPGEGTTINVPLPPGSGSGAYRAAFDRVVTPALDVFAPQLILVSAGFDASYLDPLGQMMLGSEDYRAFTRLLQAAAERHCAGRVVAVHEGGYSEHYVPFCGLAVIEQLSGVATQVKDPYWADVSAFGMQALQPWQDERITQVEVGPLALLVQKMREQQRKL